MRWLLLVTLVLSGCSCDENADLAAEGFVRCHLADPPEEREWTHGDARLRIEGRTLTIEGLPDPLRIAVATGPASEDAPEADLIIYLGDVAEVQPTESVTLLLAGGADEWEAWTERPESDGIVDVTTLRSVRVGHAELIPVSGAPHGRYARTDACCGVDDASPWDLGAPAPGVHRALLSWAAPSASGVAGLQARSEVLATLEQQVAAEVVIFAWPRLDARSVRPASGGWVTRGDGSREAAGWTLFEAGADGLERLPDSP